MKAKYAKWTKGRRFDEAVLRVLDSDWTQTAAATEFGVSRQHLNIKVQEERQRRADSKADLLKSGYTPTRDLKYTMPYKEWDDKYFGHMICPDCGVHHDTPDFHDEISSAVRGPEQRVVVNIPPYHSKSTNVTIKDTVYDLCMDPDMLTIIVSKSQPFASTFVYLIEEMLTNHEMYLPDADLINDFGPFRPERASLWSSTRFYVAKRKNPQKDPSVQALGVNGHIYGRRAHKIKFDDIATLKNQKNPDLVLDMLRWIDQEAFSRIGRNGKAIFVGTRVHGGDIYSVLQKRSGYKVLRYPVILDEEQNLTLWPDHFPWSQVELRRLEMSNADFQLVYQNIDAPGAGASFPADIVEACKDYERTIGQYDPQWRLVAGLDPAGGKKTSGYTAFSLEGVDLATGNRYLVDQAAFKGFKAPQLKAFILDWSERYPIYLWKVENNGVQDQLVQYNEEIIRPLALKGIRVEGHTTGSNKWDSDFGVETLAPLMAAGMVSIPWGNRETRGRLQPFIEELLSFPLGALSDRLMSFWFSDLGIRDLLKRSHLPMFDESVHIPNRLKRRRRIVDFAEGQVSPLPLHQQRAMFLNSPGADRRLVVGHVDQYGNIVEDDPEEPLQYANIDPRIWRP